MPLLDMIPNEIVQITLMLLGLFAAWLEFRRRKLEGIVDEQKHEHIEAITTLKTQHAERMETMRNQHDQKVMALESRTQEIKNEAAQMSALITVLEKTSERSAIANTQLSESLNEHSKVATNNYSKLEMALHENTRTNAAIVQQLATVSEALSNLSETQESMTAAIAAGRVEVQNLVQDVTAHRNDMKVQFDGLVSKWGAFSDDVQAMLADMPKGARQRDIVASLNDIRRDLQRIENKLGPPPKPPNVKPLPKPPDEADKDDESIEDKKEGAA